MALPDNIEKEHILSAINKIDLEGIPNGADSHYYNLIYNGKTYPPKLVISYANIFANGTELDRNSFSGGLNTQCFKILNDHGFSIQEKNKIIGSGFYQELLKFLSQSATNELGTSGYSNEYHGLSVKVSFGKGNQAKIPWIAFLNEIDTVQQGIYPVYLYYKELNLLFLAFGVSETNTPNRTWNLSNLKSIKQFFIDNNLGKPERYGTSFVFKVYDTTTSLLENTINKDLSEIITIYKTKSPSMETSILPDLFKYSQFNINALSSGLYFNNITCLRFISALLTKPFVILTGLSGSGKTKLAQAFALWICEYENQYCIVPVGADWTNREPLLGFPNALKVNDYVKPDNKVLDLIIEANKNDNKPYFLILDEMNLSHVERYFADFLSVMESKNDIALHSGKDEWNGVPAKIGFPKNLFIIGTVNIDETTYMFSPKVLDRANVIEFRVTAKEMAKYLTDFSEINLENLIGMGKEMANNFVQLALDKHIIENEKERGLIIEPFNNFFSELKKCGAEFGYRSAFEIMRFAGVAKKLDVDWKENDIIDAAIMQKLLPKVHGSRRKIIDSLVTLAGFCFKTKEGETISEADKKTAVQLYISETKLNEKIEIIYPISLEKISRMIDNAIKNGFTSYAEA